jgi:hypothetical protein
VALDPAATTVAAPAVTAPGDVWTLVGSEATGFVLSGDITLALPSGLVAGDLLIAQISYRDSAAFTAPAGWTTRALENEGNTLGSGSGGAIASLLVVSHVYDGITLPSGLFTRTGGDVAAGHVVAMRANQGAISFVDATSATPAATTTPATAGMDWANNDLIFIHGTLARNGSVSNPRIANRSWPNSNFTLLTPPDLVTPAAQWRFLAQSSTTDGASAAIFMARALSDFTGATGNALYFFGFSRRHVIAATIWRIS